MANIIFACIAALLCITVKFTLALQPVNGKIKISIGTTSVGTDSVNFIVNQLIPTYELYSESLELEFIPWGRTVMYDNGTMSCEFGANDCWANRLHRCVLNQLSNNQRAQVEFMKCEFTTLAGYVGFSFTCAESIGLDTVVLETCVSASGDQLDLNAQAAAAEPMRIIDFVPTIVFNDVIDIDLHDQAITDLTRMVEAALNSENDNDSGEDNGGTDDNDSNDNNDSNDDNDSNDNNDNNDNNNSNDGNDGNDTNDNNDGNVNNGNNGNTSAILLYMGVIIIVIAAITVIAIYTTYLLHDHGVVNSVSTTVTKLTKKVFKTTDTPPVYFCKDSSIMKS